MMEIAFPRSGNRDARTRHRTQSRRTQRDDHVRFDGADLALEPFVACGHLALRRRLVNAPFTARLPAEMLDGVRQIEIGRRDTCFAYQASQ
jgi:hypothetical protein